MPAYDGLNPLATSLIWEELSHSTINTQKLFIHIIMSCHIHIYAMNEMGLHGVAQVTFVTFTDTSPSSFNDHKMAPNTHGHR